LSGAPLAKSDADPAGESVVEKFLDTLGSTLEPVYGFRSLLAFKAKFHRQDRGKIPMTWVRRGSPAFGQQAGLRG